MTQFNINSVKREISEGMDLIKKSTKANKLADSLDAGWRMVEQYVTYTLVKDSEDEKIYKAHNRAEIRLKKEKLKRRPACHTHKFVPGERKWWINIRPGRCFYCNEYGHLIRKYPKSVAEQKQKVSTICKFNKVKMYTHPETDLTSVGALYSISNLNSITHVHISCDVQTIINTHTTTIVKITVQV